MVSAAIQTQKAGLDAQVIGSMTPHTHLSGILEIVSDSIALRASVWLKQVNSSSRESGSLTNSQKVTLLVTCINPELINVYMSTGAVWANWAA